jgi:hypothetical protein
MNAPQEINTLAVEDSTKTRIRNGFDEGLRLSPAEALFDIQAEGLTEYPRSSNCSRTSKASGQ